MCRLVLMTIAVLAILFGISGLYMMPKLIQQKIEQRIQLKIGTKTFDRFTRIPIPLTVKFYFFNVTNSEQVLAGLERPKFQEIGPFMFKQWRRREVVDILDNNRKMTYKEIKTFYAMYPQEYINTTTFLYYNTETGDIRREIAAQKEQQDGEEKIVELGSEQARDNLKESKTTYIKMLNPYAHNITLVNLPLLSVLTQLAQLEYGTIKRSLAAKIVSRLIVNGHEKILITRGANQFLFDGYKVGLMDAASDLISNTLGYNFESPLPSNKFGFFHTKNGTWSRREAGEMTIITGRNNSMDDFMLVDSWNGLKTLSVWPRTAEAGNRCNELRGTDGSQFHPGVSRQQELAIFSPMICTSIFVRYREDTAVRGIPLMRFTTPPEMFAAPKKHAQNSCYCTVRQEHQQRNHQAATTQRSDETAATSVPISSSSGGGEGSKQAANSRAKLTNARCYIDGLMDLSLCQRGAPIAASSPHFYNSDPMLAMAAGLEPRKEKHETYLDIEPMTGAVMRAASRAQINAFVEQAALEVVEPGLIGHMAPMVAPMLWLEEAAQIDEKSSAEFKSQLLNLVQKAKRSFIYAIAVGLLLIALVGLQYWYVSCYKLGPVSKRQADLEEQLETPARRRARRRKEQELKKRAGDCVSTRRLTGALRANLVGRQPLMGSNEKCALGDESAHLQSSSVAVAAGGVAAALCAAPSVASNQNARRNDYEQDNDDDETLSKRALVTSEWPVPGKSGLTSGGSSPSSPSTSSGDCAGTASTGDKARTMTYYIRNLAPKR